MFHSRKDILILGLFVVHCFCCLEEVQAQQVLTEELHSLYLSDTRQLRLCMPDKANENQPHQVIYVLDEAGLFDLVVATTRYLAHPEVDLMPPAVVVGIQGKYDQLHKELGFNFRQGTLSASGENFRKFLIEEIPAFLKTRLPNVVDFEVLVGQGTSALYALDFNEEYPGTFEALIALAPENPNYELDLVEPFLGLNRRQFLYLATAAGDLSVRRQFAHRTSRYLERHPQANLRFRYDSIPVALVPTLAPRALPRAFEFIYQDYNGGPGLEAWYARTAIDRDNYVEWPARQNQEIYRVPIRPTAATATVLLAKALELDDGAGAQKIIQDFRDRAADDPGLYTVLAEFLQYDLKAPKEAETLYLQAIRKFQESGAPYRAIPAYFRLMDLYVGQQNGEAAWELGQSARTLLKVGTFDYQLGKIADAFDLHLPEAIMLNEQLLEKGGAANADEPAIKYLLAQLYVKVDQPEQAKKLLREILQVQENHAGARKLLEQL